MPDRALSKTSEKGPSATPMPARPAFPDLRSELRDGATVASPAVGADVAQIHSVATNDSKGLRSRPVSLADTFINAAADRGFSAPGFP